jgi:dipeptidyl aminopeptidase/acylaminoacyl peptidase
MRRCTLQVMASLGYALLLGHVARAAVPLEVYGRLPSLEDIALSPSGERIDCVRTTENTRTITVGSLSDHKAMSGLRVGDQKLRSVQWADENHLMIVTSATSLPWGFIGKEQEWRLLQVYDVGRRKAYPVPSLTFADPNLKLMNVISGPVMIRRLKGHTVLFVPGIYVEHETLAALFRVDLDTATQSLVRKGTSPSQKWLVDADGEIAAEEDYNQQAQHWKLKIRREGRLQEVASGQAAIEFPRFLGFGPTSDTLLMQSPEGKDPAWRLLSLKDGTWGPPMAEHRMLTAPIEDHLTSCMIGGVHIGDDAQYVFFDPIMQARWDAVTHAFAGEHVRLLSAADGFRKFVVRVDGTKHGYLYELVDLVTHRADSLGEVYKGGAPALEVRRITYAAADGMQIPAYLTLPQGRAARNLPLIVLPHGGPAARDTADFEWWPQALADQNYAVLQPNFRGSDLNEHFLEAGFGQWGRKMQTDLSDGVRYLVKEGIADPARVCIVGASYGGYAALAGVTLDPGIYRCAVAVAGVSDLQRMLQWVNEKNLQRSSFEQRYWNRFMGVSGPSDPVLDEISPIKHMDALTVPVLLIHGRDDTVVPFEQSSVMAEAMRRAKKDVEFVTLAHEDHWLSRSETRLQMLKASVAFLRARNPPD